MREIKFKGLDIKGNWHYGLLCIDKEGTFISNSEGCPKAFEVRPETIGEFTGLKDKKRTKEFSEGQEIYEGDIVNAVQNYHGKPSSIMFNAKIIYNDNIGSFMISYKNINDMFVNDEIWLRYFLEVIGNIHETPELL